MRATNRTWPFMPWTREAWFRPRREEAPGTERSLARAEQSRRRFERRLRDSHRAPGSCSPPIPPWACLTRRGLVGEERARRAAAAAVGVREAAEVRAALAAEVRAALAAAALAAGVLAAVVEQAAPGAAVARVVAGAREVRAVAPERVVEVPAERVAAERQTQTFTIQRIVSRGPSFRRFPRR